MRELDSKDSQWFHREQFVFGIVHLPLDWLWLDICGERACHSLFDRNGTGKRKLPSEPPPLIRDVESNSLRWERLTRIKQHDSNANLDFWHFSTPAAPWLTRIMKQLSQCSTINKQWGLIKGKGKLGPRELLPPWNKYPSIQHWLPRPKLVWLLASELILVERKVVFVQILSIVFFLSKCNSSTTAIIALSEWVTWRAVRRIRIINKYLDF